MRRALLALCVVFAALLDYFILPLILPARILPDIMIALLVSLGVLTGLLPAVPIAVGAGVLLDIAFNRFIGMSAIPYFFASLIGAAFYSRFYADNPIIPSAAAAAAAFLKELILLAALLLSGGKVNGVFALFALHVLPASLLTGAACIPIRILLKKNLLRSSFRLDIDYTR